MNRRHKKKKAKAVNELLQNKLLLAVTELDKDLYPEANTKTKYQISVKHLPYREARFTKHINNLKIEIRDDEKCHARPHFHVTLNHNEQSVSIALDNFEVLAGELDNKYMKVVLPWVQVNAELLNTAWELCHGKSKGVQVA